jgi:hypothetical protein
VIHSVKVEPFYLEFWYNGCFIFVKNSRSHMLFLNVLLGKPLLAFIQHFERPFQLLFHTLRSILLLNDYFLMRTILRITHPTSTHCTISFLIPSVRTQHDGLRSPLTAAAPTRSSSGERKRYNSLWAATPLQCRRTGSSRPTYWMRMTAGILLSTPREMQPQPWHQWQNCRRSQLRGLHAPVATSASPHASTPEH